MPEICRILEQPAPAPTRQAQGSGRTKERLLPTRMVKISGRALEDELLNDKVLRIDVEENARGLSKATIVFQNDQLRFTDHELLQGSNLEVEVYTGYDNTRLVKRGKFFAAVPRYAFRNRAMPLVTLECFSEEWPLAVSERRTAYENLTSAEIAARIARQHGLKIEAQSTEPRHEHVAQFNMTDMEFLENRALLYGYDVYVQDGVLHFHEPRFKHSELTLFYSGGETGVLNSFEVCVDPWVTGSKWVSSGIDRITGKEYEFKSDDQRDAVSQEIKRRGGPGYRAASTLSEIGGSQPTRYIVGEGHEQSEDEARAQVAGFARASEWVVLGSGLVRGIEVLKARQVVTISGIGHLAGDYYVTSAIHSYSPDGYTTRFKVVRPGVGRLDDRAIQSGGASSRRDVTSDSQIVGEAAVE